MHVVVFCTNHKYRLQYRARTGLILYRIKRIWLEKLNLKASSSKCVFTQLGKGNNHPRKSCSTALLESPKLLVGESLTGNMCSESNCLRHRTSRKACNMTSSL